ncbi:MAG: adenylate kinase [Candidatus Omnitrophota bacterium]
MNIVLLGPPGAGKGTQAKVLSQEFKAIHISTGDMLRDAVKRGTSVGEEAKSFMDKGELVPDRVVTDIVVERISQPDVKDGFLLDGFPRNERQADDLDRSLSEREKHIDIVLYFRTAPEVSIQRLSGRRVCKACGANFHATNMPPKEAGVCDYCNGGLIQRDDDKEETVKRRLVIYEKETRALIDYYSDKGTLREIPGDLEVKQLFKVVKEIFSRENLL